jgi:hypothetical protein
MFGSGACNKGAAEESLQEAGRAIEDARADLERYAPEELAALSQALEDARSDIEAGHYTQALRAAQELPARIRSARATAGRRKDELQAVWDELSPRVPTLIEELRARIDRLVVADGGVTTAPREARLRAARTDLGALVDAWEEATAAHQRGEMAHAVRMARDLHARARTLAGVLGLVTAPRPVEAGDPAGLE